MLLKEQDGILCDICGSTHRVVFTYYSMEGSRIVVDATKQAINKQVKDIDVDACAVCYEKIMTKVRSNLGNSPTNGIKCDISGKVFTGKFEYYTMIADKIEVDGSRCLESEENIPPEVEIDKKVMDFKMGKEYVNSLTNTMLKTRKQYMAEAKNGT